MLTAGIAVAAATGFQPAGSYQHSCTCDPLGDGNALACTCGDGAGSDVRAGLDLATCSAIDSIANAHGQLVCPLAFQTGFVPGGSFLDSCNSCEIAQNALTCSCLNRADLPVSSALALATCGSIDEISNSDGNLACRAPETGGRTLGGSYTATCNSCGVEGNTLTCDCLHDGDLVDSTSLDLAACASTQTISNTSGMLTCREIAAEQTIEDRLDAVFARGAKLTHVFNLKFGKTTTATTSSPPSTDGMDEGTQLVAVGGTWYLFNREFDYVPAASIPAVCTKTSPTATTPGVYAGPSRIVVRKSTDRGATWLPAQVLAEPDFAQDECILSDGAAFWDPDTSTWHYLAQVLINTHPTKQSEFVFTWHIKHYTFAHADPTYRDQTTLGFAPDPGRPAVKSGDLWSKICGPGKACPTNTLEEGTPEISFKAQGYFYVTFHGIHDARVSHRSPDGVIVDEVDGYRGIAKTRDFRTWIETGDDLPGDAMWSAKDCAPWAVAWLGSGCVGGGHASSLLTAHSTYMLIESSDLSVGCTKGQHWVAGLVRAPTFQTSGNWHQLAANPLLVPGYANAPCGVQYPRLFVDPAQAKVYVTYWLLGATGPHDDKTSFFIDELTAQP